MTSRHGICLRLSKTSIHQQHLPESHRASCLLQINTFKNSQPCFLTRKQQQRHVSRSPEPIPLASIKQTLTTRKIPVTYEDLYPSPSARLSAILSANPQQEEASPSSFPPPPLPSKDLKLTQGHEQIYLEPTLHPSQLEADGTFPTHSPGETWTRRLWAGGRVLYNPDEQFALRLDGSRGVSAEFIRDVTTRGSASSGARTKAKPDSSSAPSPPRQEGQLLAHPRTRLRVEVERRKALASAEEVQMMRELDGLLLGGKFSAAHSEEVRELQARLDHHVRQRLWRKEAEDVGPAAVVETRQLLFARPSTHRRLDFGGSSSSSPDAGVPGKAEAGSEAAAGGGGRRIQGPPAGTRPFVEFGHKRTTFSRKFTLSPALLFHFSALTFNAHALHLDRAWAQQEENFPLRLAQGPLTFVLMMEVLRGEGLHGQPATKRWLGQRKVASVEYTNHTPLFEGEEVSVCALKMGDYRWICWILNGEGGLAVQAKVEMVDA